MLTKRNCQCVLVGTFIAALVMLCSAKETSITAPTVNDIDLSSFSGTWYEIARIPNNHEKGMVDVTSTFTIESDGMIQITNRGYKGKNGKKVFVVKGNVSIPNKANNGSMKVKLYKIFTVDYKIIDLDKKNYQYALVTTGSKDFLWVLCKSPIMDDDMYSQLVDSAAEKGFQTHKLERVSQDFNTATANR